MTRLERCGPSRSRRSRLRGALAAFVGRRDSSLPPPTTADRFGTLELWYQPKVSLRDGAVVCVEALLRERLAPGTVALPHDLLHRAEDSSIGLELTDWVLRRALSRMQCWLLAHPDISVAVNVSPRVVTHEQFGEVVATRLAEAGVPPTRLLLEITEGARIADVEQARRQLEPLIAAGVTVSLDDFGAGCSGFSHLSAVPAVELKIDREYVAAMPTDSTNAAVVRSLVGLGRTLGLRVVAEGVETPRAASMLRRMGCDAIQGHLVSPALPFQHLLTFLDRPVPTGGTTE